MPYVTGTAVSMAAVLTALRNACTDNGWTLSGNVLHKDGCYAEVRIGNNGETGAPTNTMLYVKAGNGIDGGNALTDAAGTFGMIGPLRAATGDTWPDWDWPINYHVHVHDDPDEVYLFVNYGGGEFWQLLAFGKSPAPGNPGTGNWHHGFTGEASAATPSYAYRRVDSCGAAPAGAVMGFLANARCCPFPFWWGQFNNATGTGGSNIANHNLPSRIHGAIDATSGLPIWSAKDLTLEYTGAGEDGRVSAAVTQRPLVGYSPSTFNNQMHLFPLQVLAQRPSNKTSIIGQLAHARICRNDFILPGQIETLGAEQWKVYPGYRRNAAERNGGNRLQHSGTMAIAVRYDG